MYELTDLLITIASCSATVIVIVGGFIASKLIALSTEREEVLTKLFEIEEEIRYKSKKVADARVALEEDDALDFIKDNIKSVVFGDPLDKVYKKEERLNLTEEELSPYWERAIKICERLINIIRETDEEENDDGVPNILAVKIEENFEYRVCKYAAKCIKRIQKEQERKNSILSFPLVDYDLPIINPINANWFEKQEMR